MSKSIKIILIIIIFFGISALAIAQETQTSEVTEAVNLDENIQPEDLEVGEPTILPDHPIYFLKNWIREIRSFFAFRSVTKAKLRSEFANEKLMEIKKMIEEKKAAGEIEKGLENYQEEIEKIKGKADRIKERARENLEVENFLDKFLHQQTLHQKLLAKLEEQVPAETFQIIKQTRERHLERFQEVMLKLEDRNEEITEKLDKTLENQEGSRYKNFKNLEILLELEEKVPEQTKEAIRKAQENSLKRLKGDLEQMSSEDQEKFKEYIERISGEKETQLEILENLKSELIQTPQLQANIIGRTRELIIERLGEQTKKLNCPDIEKPAPDFCERGRIMANRDEKGCVISFECIIPEEIVTPPKPRPEVCITLWDPVCGVDGKTYSNECFARLAEVEIDYRGVCKTE